MCIRDRCCTLHGLRAFADLHSQAFRGDGSEVCLELPIDAKFQKDGTELIASSKLCLLYTSRCV